MRRRHSSNGGGMLRKSQWARLFLLVAGGQLAALATGLCLHQHLVAQSLRDAGQARNFAELERVARDCRSRLSATKGWPDHAASGAAEPGRAWLPQLEHQRPTGFALSLLDADWRLVAAALPDAMTAAGPVEADAVQWRARRAADTTGEALRGTLAFGGRGHDAVALPLPAGGGYVVVHRPAVSLSRAGHLWPLAGVTFVWLGVLLMVTLYLGWAQQHEAVQEVKSRSTTGVLRQTQELVRTRDAVIFALAKLAGFRDHETGDHLERISDYSSMLAAKAREHPKFSQQISSADVRLIGLSSVLHDIGKVGIEDAVLRKPTVLTPAERERMEMHTVLAGECLREIAQRLGDSRFLQMAAQIALGHHERWDGTGYPHRVAGTSIPLCARIVAIVDVYDALSTPRVYKDALPHAECVAEIRRNAGTQFDPDLVDIWLSIADRFEAISSRVAARAGTPSRFQPAAPPVAAGAAAAAQTPDGTVTVAQD